MWSARLFEARDVPNVEGSWAERVSTARHRPDEATLSRAYNTYYSCGGGGCDNARCLRCSDEGPLQVRELRCARFMRVSRAASCGTGRLGGGDAKAACLAGPVDDWVLGQGQGDDVEIFTAPPPEQDGPVPAEKLTIVKIVNFFLHEGNVNSIIGGARPLTWWVLGYDYVGIGAGNERVQDSITGHPTLQLRGRGRPLVFPVDAVRRQVHMYHQCPQRSEIGSNRTFVCGAREAGSTRRGRIWCHRFRLATPGSSNGYDRYLLNEVHHSINQDTFL